MLPTRHDTFDLFGEEHLLILGGGELGRYLALAAARQGLRLSVIAGEPGSPAAQLAHHAYTCDLSDEAALGALIAQICPDAIVTEIESVALQALEASRRRGVKIIPGYKALLTCTNRRRLRQFLAEELSLKTSAYRFASSPQELFERLGELNAERYHVKPMHASSGRGQREISGKISPLQARRAYELAAASDYRGAKEVMIEAHVDFALEVTVLVVATGAERHLCEPIGHEQQRGDYVRSWQPCALQAKARARMNAMALQVVEALGGQGVFGVEFFLTRDDEVLISEVAPRPHDTGLVTLITHDRDQFELHLAAALGRAMPAPRLIASGASGALRAHTPSSSYGYRVPTDQIKALQGVEVHHFRKPSAYGGRRVGVCLAAHQGEVSARGAELALTRIKEAQRHIEIFSKND